MTGVQTCALPIFRKSDDPKSYTDVTPEQLVENSHAALDKK